MTNLTIEKKYTIKFTKKSKYESARVRGWDDSEGFLTDKQIDFILQDEKEMAEKENRVHS